MLNKTPKVSAKKTKLARSKRGYIGYLLLAAFVAIVLGLYVANIREDREVNSANPKQCLTTLASDQCVVQLEYALTSDQHMLGLSGRSSLNGTGLAFIFSEPGRQCFWMKDMLFSIDMIFLNSKKQIIQIYSNVAPDTYPKNFCEDNAQYVVELEAGKAKTLGLHAGNALGF